MESLCPNHNMLFGLQSTLQYGEYGIYRHKVLEDFIWSPIVEESWKASILETTVNIMAMSGVRCLVTPFELETERLAERARWESGLRGVSIRIYEVTEALPPARMVQRFRIYQGPEAISSRFLVESFHDMERIRTSVILEKMPQTPFGPGVGVRRA